MSIHLHSFASYWAEFFGSCGVLLVAWRLWKLRLQNWWRKMRRKTAAEEVARGRDMVERLKVFLPPGFARIWSVVSLFIIVGSWYWWAWLAIADHRQIVDLKSELAKYRSETVVEHHVTILARLEDGDFSFRSDEEPSGSSFRPCLSDIVSGLDVNRLLTDGIGYVANHASWEERGVCKSILGADLGFSWRDKETDFKYRYVATKSAH